MRKKLILAVASPLLFLALLELAARVAGVHYPPVEFPMVVWNRQEDQAMRLGTSMHRVEARQLWSPKPGQPIPWGASEVVNAAGYRGPELPLERTAGVLRVATLGDSSTFGFGVAYPDAYTARLPAALGARGLEAESLCGGVIGFTVRQGLERWSELVEPYRPDYVVAAFGAVNDHLNAINKPDDAMIPRDVSSDTPLAQAVLVLRRELRLLHWLAQVRDERDERARAERDKLVKAEARRARRLQKLGKKSYKGLRRVPLETFERCLRDLAHEVEAAGGTLVLLSMPRQPAVEERSPVLLEYTAAIERVAAEERLPLADGRGAFRARLEDGTAIEELFVDWFHPSPAGHALLAEVVADAIARAEEARAADPAPGGG